MDEEPKPWWHWPLFLILLLIVAALIVYFRDLRIAKLWGG